MALAETRNGDVWGEADRRHRIIEAAERAFVRHGFHATTMQHVAAEAAMSPGNLYRYFPSKEAIVQALCARDQAERGRAFATFAQAESVIAAMAEGLRMNLLGKPREKMQMILEIWAEAARNPAIAALCGAIDADVHAGLMGLVEAAKGKGEAVADLDADFAARLMITVVVGLFKRRAHETDFDGERELSLALGIFVTLFRGGIRPFSAPDAKGAV
ncbi:MAG: TetR/AcrR family transcriptional regulator [Hyphomicrobiales bacterium]|nr:TetR/AcrR family transcriptional regulator [Hyphomicrobiales bacterium]MBV9112698.1 TetR/AcrR family transcriptional regulator [Hyphomicrobiales bacterium]